MADISTDDIKRLREMTGAGIMDCKQALIDSDGDFDKAIEALRIKGAKDVGKRATRTAGNGLVAATDRALVELNCETDFVAKNEQFQALAAEIVARAAEAKTADVDALLAETLTPGRTVAEAIEAVSAVVGEKLELRRVAVFDGPVATYLHRRSADLPPQIGVVVEYDGSDEGVARSVAMQIAAIGARYVTRDEVPADVADHERRIAEATAREEGKPEAALPKIVEGRLSGFFKEVVLTEQASVQDSKKTVGQLLADAGLTVRRFTRFEVGRA